MLKKIQDKLTSIVEKYAGDATTTVAANRAPGQFERSSLMLLWTITGVFFALFIWIAVAEVDTVTRADGRVVPSAKLQIIQNLEGGIVAEILTKAGAPVEKGDKLVALSAVLHDSEMNSRHQQLLALDARASRLTATTQGTKPKFSKDVTENAPDVLTAEMSAYYSKKSEQESQLGVVDAQLAQKQRELEEVQASQLATKRSLTLGRDERDTISHLVERGLEPRLELVRADRMLAELEGRAAIAAVTIERVRSAIGEMRARRDATMRQIRSEELAELGRTMADLNTLQQSMPALTDRVARTEIRAPMKGIVNRVFVTTLGGIVKPGDPIIEIVPGDDQLIVEALVNPRDIGFVKLGQSANVKITAYDYSIFGSMEGKVVNISGDAVPNEKGEAFYQVRIETKTLAIEAIDKKLPIIPGMQAQIDIITGKKTILQFLSKPIIALKENSFRER
jgi:membrane fusion protein, adhesin transport system